MTERLRAHRRSAALRRAVLERAFRAELVPQDPSDEPAEVLLVPHPRRAQVHSGTGFAMIVQSPEAFRAWVIEVWTLHMDNRPDS